MAPQRIGPTRVKDARWNSNRVAMEPHIGIRGLTLFPLFLMLAF